MKRLLLIGLITFTGCVVAVQRPPTAQPQPSPAPAPGTQQIMLSARAGLPLPPGATLLTLDAKSDGSSKAVFQTRDGIEQVYTYFHNQLSARGWVRTELEFKSKATKLEAKYARQGTRFELKLDQQGNSGRYSIEIDF
jgi:hypothetical protein